MAKLHALESTNVRFHMVLIALAACSGCATTVLAGARPCQGGGLPVCERFGPEQQCECAAPHEMTRLMSSFGEAAW